MYSIKNIWVGFRYWLSPFFILNFLILKQIRRINEKYKFTGIVIDIGCGQKPYKKYFKNLNKYYGIDFKEYSLKKDYTEDKPDYFFSDEYKQTYNLSFKNNEFDHSFSFQVLEHHPNPQKMIDEMVRITKPGGYILITAPYIWGIHEQPNHYFHFTKFGLIELFKGKDVEILEITEIGSYFATISMLSNELIAEHSYKHKIDLFLVAIFIYPFLLIFQYFCFILDHIFKTKRITLNYIILCKKN